MLEGGIGYMRIRSFFEESTEDSAVAFMRRHRDLRAIVGDVRGNGGGSTPTALTEALMDRPWRWFTETTPHWSGLARGIAIAQGY